MTESLYPPDFASQSMQTFAVRQYMVIEEAITARQQGWPQLKDLDPFTTDSCRAAVFSVPEAKIAQHNLQVSGAYIGLPFPEGIKESIGHAYFTSTIETDLVLDFTAGQFASALKTTLDSWRKKYPELFLGKALMGSKTTIAKTLGLIYPQRNKPFWTFFNEE